MKHHDQDGIQLMQNIHHIIPDLPAIILTAHRTIKNAVDAMKKGAHSYLTKPFDGHELLMQINNCLETSKLSKEVKQLQRMVKERYGFDNIIGRSETMKKVLQQVKKAAAKDVKGRYGGDKVVQERRE